jgi:hypothetical protein
MESGSATTGTFEDGAEFSYQLTEKDGVLPDLMIYCPEDMMAAPGEAFAKWLKLENGSTLTVPGGAMLLARLDDVTVDESLKPFQRSIVEVLKRYTPRRVVLVTHTYCVYYDTIAAWNDDLANVKGRQVADMRAALRVLGGWFPRAQISGYLAEEDANRKLVFHAVDPEGKTPQPK